MKKQERRSQKPWLFSQKALQNIKSLRISHGRAAEILGVRKRDLIEFYNTMGIIDPLLRERARYLKETEGGRETMCKLMEDRITEEKIELAKKAIMRGIHSLEEIAEDFELPLAVVRELAKQKTA